MERITVTQTHSGKIRGTSDNSDSGGKLSNGDTYMNFSRGAFTVTGPAESSRTFFQLNTNEVEGIGPQKNMTVAGADGKDNILILPGSPSDYTVKVAQEPQGLGFSQKMGDITITDNAGNNVNTVNMKSIAFLNGKTPDPIDTVNDIASGKLKTVPAKELFDKSFKALPTMEQCKLQAITSDAARAHLMSQKTTGREALDLAQANVIKAATKACPTR